VTLLWTVSLAWAGFGVELAEGLDQTREIVSADHALREGVRQLPDQDEPWTLYVQVPEPWLDQDSDAADAPQALGNSTPQQAELLRALAEAKLPGAASDPVARLGTLTGLLQNGSFEHARPAERGEGVVELWVLLYDPEAGDTLSASVHALALSEALGLSAELVRYPCPNSPTGFAYGLTTQGTPPTDVTWAWAVPGGRVLLPLHPSADPGDLSEMQSWTLAQVYAGELGGAPAPVPQPPAPAPVTPDPTPAKERNPDSLFAEQNLPYTVGSGILAAALLVFGVWWLRLRSAARSAREALKKKRTREEF
jgi:hypothetical protein